MSELQAGLTGPQLAKLQDTLVAINSIRDGMVSKTNQPVSMAEDLEKLIVFVDELSDLTFIVEGYVRNHRADVYHKTKDSKVDKHKDTTNKKTGEFTKQEVVTQTIGATELQMELRYNKEVIQNDLFLEKLKMKQKNMLQMITTCQSILRVKAAQHEGRI